MLLLAAGRPRQGLARVADAGAARAAVVLAARRLLGCGGSLSPEGVDATTHTWEEMPHVFPTSIGPLDAAERQK